MATEWFELIPAQTKGVCSGLMIVHVSAITMGENKMSHIMRPSNIRRHWLFVIILHGFFSLKDTPGRFPKTYFLH